MPCVLVLAVCSLVAAAPWTQLGYKLSGPLTAPPTVEGDVEDARLSPDGRWLVYLARQDDAAVAELYSVARDGSAEAVKLSGTLVEGGAIDDFAISPDGLWVVYQAEQEQLSVHELLSVPIDGSANPTVLSRAREAHAFFRYEIGPDSRRVAFLDTLDLRLRLVPIQGGSARSLHALQPGGYVLEFHFGPEGKRVLFTADPDGRSGLNLYSAAVESARTRGHARRRSARPVRLNSRLTPGTDIFSFRVGANGR